MMRPKALATASTSPETVRIRSTAPLVYSLTVHLASSDVARIWETFSPPLPITVAASALEMMART